MYFDLLHICHLRAGGEQGVACGFSDLSQRRHPAVTQVQRGLRNRPEGLPWRVLVLPECPCAQCPAGGGSTQEQPKAPSTLASPTCPQPQGGLQPPSSAATVCPVLHATPWLLPPCGLGGSSRQLPGSQVSAQLHPCPGLWQGLRDWIARAPSLTKDLCLSFAWSKRGTALWDTCRQPRAGRTPICHPLTSTA